MSDQPEKASQDSLEVDVPVGRFPSGPGFATTAIGPTDVRDTPRIPTEDMPRVDPWIGRVLSNVYRVEAKLGEGGMGAVYTARHVHLNKPYAVKVLGAAIATNATAVERLKQEAIAASSIDHDNIVEVISFDRYADGAVFIVMELLRGESLADRLARGPIPLHQALPIAHQICAALGAAHARDIVHRDLKPENVFLAKKGEVERVKVLDFGISKVKSADAEQVKMTRTGQLVGTPLYMSPEQARGETDIDRRVDVYALGVILYEMLTGSPPFEGRNYFELLWKHGNESAQSLKQRNPNVYCPDEVDAVVLRALAKRREERFQTMEELSAAMIVAAPDVAVPAAGTSLPPSRPSGDLRTSSPTPRSSPGIEVVRAPDKTESMPAPPMGKTPPWAFVAGGALVAVMIGVVAVVMGGGSGEGAAETATVAEAVTAGRPPETGSAETGSGTGTGTGTGAGAGTGVGASVGAGAGAGPEMPTAIDPASVVEVAIDSIPPGAEVRDGERVLGTTPFFADLSRGAPTQLVFHRDGYLDRTEELVPAEGARVSVRLRPRRRSGSPSSDDGSSLSIKTEL